MIKPLLLLCATFCLAVAGRAQSAYICRESATVSVTAGSTTEIVSLAAGQRIRVCGFTVSMTAAGTAKWVEGTGTNCGTGQADLTAALSLATGTPWPAYAGMGSSVFRPTTAGNALCLAAVTGNVLGVVSYAYD